MRFLRLPPTPEKKQKNKSGWSVAAYTRFGDGSRIAVLDGKVNFVLAQIITEENADRGG